MVIWHLRSNRKNTGARIVFFRKKKARDKGKEFIETKIGKNEVRSVDRVRGGNIKWRLKFAVFANVSDSKGRTKKVRILDVLENKANTQYSRQNIITKGAIINTEIGKAVVVNKPSQEGFVNAVLLEEESKNV